MSALTVKLRLLGLQAAIAGVALLNINPVLAETQPQNIAPLASKDEFLESQNFSYKANDLVPEGVLNQSINKDALIKVEAIAQTQSRSNPVRFNPWSISAEALFLTRNIPGGIITSELYDVNTTGTGETLGTDNLDFKYELGTRVTIGYSLNPKNSLNFSFFGLQNFETSGRLTAPAPGFPNPVLVQADLDDTPIFPPLDTLGDRINVLDQPPPGGRGNGNFDITRSFISGYEHRIDYESKLYNFEFNYQRDLGSTRTFRPSLIVGLRYMGAPEEFSLTTGGAAAFSPQGLLSVPRGEYKVETKNNLFGIQIGANVDVDLSRNFTIGLRGKAGVFGNHGEQSSTISAFDFDTGNLVDRIENGEIRWTVAPVLEGTISADWRVSRNVSLIAGFNVVYVSGVALAPRQLDDFASTGNFGSVDLDGSSLYYGPSVGIKVVF
jgi:Legionella pneumophila major outer membrane protein precursor